MTNRPKTKTVAIQQLFFQLGNNENGLGNESHASNCDFNARTYVLQLTCWSSLINIKSQADPRESSLWDLRMFRPTDAVRNMLRTAWGCTSGSDMGTMMERHTSDNLMRGWWAQFLKTSGAKTAPRTLSVHPSGACSLCVRPNKVRTTHELVNTKSKSRGPEVQCRLWEVCDRRPADAAETWERLRVEGLWRHGCWHALRARIFVCTASLLMWFVQL